MGAWPTFECEGVTPYSGFACAALLANDTPPVCPGGGLFFRRGGYGGRTTALRNHGKVCVFEGAPHGRAGAGSQKVIDFWRSPLVNMEEILHFGPSRGGLGAPSLDFQYFVLPHVVRSVLKNQWKSFVFAC